MVRSFIDIAKEKIAFNIQITLFGIYLFFIFLFWQISNLLTEINIDDFTMQIIFYTGYIITISLILISHYNIGLFYGLRMAFNRMPEQIIMISPKGQIISMIFNIIIILPFIYFKNYTDNVLAQYFNIYFFIITIFAIFIGIIIEIITTNKLFTEFDDKIKIEEKVEADYSKVKTSLD